MAVAVGTAAVVCAFLAQHPDTPDQVPLWVVAASLLAILGAAIAFPSPLVHAAQRALGARDNVRLVIGGVAVMVIPSLIAAAIWSSEPYDALRMFIHPASTTGAFLWIAGALAGLVVLWFSQPASARTIAFPTTAHGRLLLILEIIALVLVLDIAIGLRVWHLAVLPEGIWLDEVDTQVGAVRQLTSPFQPLGIGNFDHNPSLYFYAMAFLIKLFGDTIGVLRMTSVLFGILAVISVYLIGRRVGGAPLGLCAAVLLAFGSWAVDFSRIAMPNIATPAMIGAGYAALCMAMYRPRAFWFALSGVVLGFALMCYEGAYLPAGIALFVAVFRMLVDRQFRQTAWPGILLLPIGFLVGAAPWFVALKLSPSFTMARITTVSLTTEYHDWPSRISAVESNLRKHLLMFTVAGDNNGRHNLAGTPMLDAVTGACFLLGLGICLRRLRHWFYLLLVCWLVASVLGGILSLDFEAPQGARSIGAVAPIALIAALPIALLARAVWYGCIALLQWRAERQQGAHTTGYAIDAATPWRWQLVATALATAVVLVPLTISYARNTDKYFARQAANMTSWSAMEGLQTILGREAAALSRRGLLVNVSPGIVGDPAFTYTSGYNVPAYDTGVPVQLPIPAGGLALLIPVTEQNVLDYVRQSFPTAQVLPLAPSFDHTQPQAYAAIIRPSDAAASLGVTVNFGARGQVMQHVEGPAPWPTGSGPRSTATIRGTLLVTAEQAWRPLAFRVSGARHASLTIDGQAWSGGAGTPPIRLGAGNHRLVVQARNPAGATLGIQWNNAPSTAAVVSAQSWSEVPSTMLAAPTLPTGGLLGLYYTGPQIGVVPVLARVDQSIYTYYQTPPVGSNFPFAARWMGNLHIMQGGSYSFKLNSVGPGTLLIDGRTVVTSNGSDAIGTVVLDAGDHMIQMDYSGTGSYLHCYLTWAPPGQSFSPIPAGATDPAHG
jgi:4-amino-4-deoxy-L-arabinose transferase-like glycosyltransferase